MSWIFLIRPQSSRNQEMLTACGYAIKNKYSKWLEEVQKTNWAINHVDLRGWAKAVWKSFW